MQSITIACEGLTDEPFARRICRDMDLEVVACHFGAGKTRIDARLSSYNRAARFGTWLVLRDLDHDAPCPAELVRRLLPGRSEHLLLRIVVRSMESWALGDAEGFARYFGVSKALLPHRTDDLTHPKRTLVTLAKRSRKKWVREGVPPLSDANWHVGPDYTPALIEFAHEHWCPIRASERSDSLRRCLDRLADLLVGT